MVNLIDPPELKLNKANTSDTVAPCLDLHLSIFNGFVSSKFMINAIILKKISYFFLFWMAMFHVSLLWSVYFYTY